jgi:hypothetical protein
MDDDWILGIVVWVLCVACVLLLFQMPRHQDRMARHVEKDLSPDSDVTITRWGDG